MKMSCLRVLSVFLLVFVVFLVEASSPVEPPVSGGEMIARYQRAIESAMENGNHDAAINMSKRLLGIIPNTPYPDVVKNSTMERIYRKYLAESYQNVGRYDNAAASIRQASAITRKPDDVETVMQMHQKHDLQKRIFEVQTQYTSDRNALRETQLSYSYRKKALIDRFNQSDDFSQQNIDNLRGQLLELREKMLEVAGQISNLDNEFQNHPLVKEHGAGISSASSVSIDDSPGAEITGGIGMASPVRVRWDIVFNQEQQHKLESQETMTRELESAIIQSQAEVSQAFTDIVRTYNVSWDGLEAAMNKLGSLQRDILGTKKALQELNSPPITIEDLQRARQLYAELKKMNARASELYAQIEDSFMNADVFNDLSPEEQAKMIALFSDVWRGHQDIYAAPDAQTIYSQIVNTYTRHARLVRQIHSSYLTALGRMANEDELSFWLDYVNRFPRVERMIRQIIIARLGPPSIINPKPRPIPLPVEPIEPPVRPTPIRDWSQVIVRESAPPTYWWPNGARGRLLPPGTAVTQALVQLTDQEVREYLRWQEAQGLVPSEGPRVPAAGGSIIQTEEVDHIVDDEEKPEATAPASLLDSF